MLISAILSRLIISGVARLTREERLWRILLYTARILGTAAILDSLGLYVTVPLSIFLSLYGLLKPLRIDKESLFVYALSRLLLLDPIPSRDNYTMYAPVVYFIVTHDPRYYPVEIHNAVAVGMFASVSRPYIFLGLDYLRTPLARATLSFLSLYQYLKEHTRSKVRPLALLAIPYRAYHVVYHPDYIDRLFALAAIEFARSYLNRDRDARIAFSVYAIAKQSRIPLLIVPIAGAFPQISLAIIILYVLRANAYQIARALPGIYILLTHKPRRVKPFLHAPSLTPLIILLARNVYIFGRPLGGSMLSFAPYLKPRLREAIEYLSRYSQGNVDRRLSVIAFLAAYLSLGGLSNVQAYSLGFVSPKDDVLRLLSAYFVFRNSIIISYPRQAIAFRIYLIAVNSDRRWLRLPTVATRVYSLAFSDLSPSPLALIAIFVLSVIALDHIYNIRSPPRLRPHYVFLPIVVLNLATYAYYAPYDFYGELRARSERIKENIDGNLLTTLSPGYIDGRLVPEVRVYQVMRAYEFYRLRGLLEAKSLYDLEEELIELRIEAFARAAYDKRINETTLDFLSTFPGAMFLSDAFEFHDGIMWTLIRVKYSRYYVVYVDLNGTRYYGCGLTGKGHTFEIEIITDAEVISVYSGAERLEFVQHGPVVKIYGNNVHKKVTIYTSRGIIALDALCLCR